MTGVWSAATGAVDGAQITLVHGSLDRSAGLLKLSRRLATRYRVMRYDRRGYGRSFSVDGPFGLDDHVADLVGLLEVEPPKRPNVLVGHSYGGNVALAIAERHPGLVDGVVTYETPLSWRTWWPNDSAGAHAVVWQTDPEQAAERFMRRLIGDDRWDRLPVATRLARRREGAAMVAELLDLRQRPAWNAARVGVPVMAMRGEFGQDHHRRSAETIADEVPEGELVVVVGARHAGPNTHPDEVAAAIHEFVERSVRPRSTA